MTESQGSTEHAWILNVGRKNRKVWKFFRSNFEEKSLNVKWKCVSSIIRSIIGRLLRALEENELLNLTPKWAQCSKLKVWNVFSFFSVSFLIKLKINQGTTKSRPIIVENLALVTAKSQLKSLAFTKFDHFLSYCADFIGRARLNGPP